MRRWAPGRWALLRARRPDSWLWAVAVAGWATLAVLAVAGHHGPQPWPEHLVAGAAMVAVMAPLIDRNVGFAVARGRAEFRAAVVAHTTAGWALPWICAVAVLETGSELLSGALGELPAIALVTALAVAWQFAPLKQRSRARCHRLIAPPLDRRRSRRACLRYGVRLGRDCVLSCGPLMALMTVSAHQPLVSAACVGVIWYERRRRPHHDPGTAETALAITAIGATAFVAAVLL